MKRSGAFLALLAAGLLYPARGEAHLRNWLDTYGYYTLERGKAELETYTDRIRPADGSAYWQNQTEVELGITDHYSLGLYGVAVDGQGFSGWRAENRVRFAEPGAWPVDTAGYLEYSGGVAGKMDDEVEAKLILSKDLASWNVTANPFLEVTREDQADGSKGWNGHPGIALATAHRTSDRLTEGVEVVFRRNESRVIPGLYINLLPEVRLNLGVGFGLVSQADRTQLRSILEIEF